MIRIDLLDQAGVTPNPARDRLTVELPRETKAERQPVFATAS